MKISVVIATYNRSHLLKRALECYVHQNFPREDFELVYVDDWSSDGTDALLREYAEKLNIVSIRPYYKLSDRWRSEASIINVGLRAAKGEFIVATHPEIMPGLTSLESLYQEAVSQPNRKTYFCTKVYFISPEIQAQIDDVNWRGSRLELRNIPGFYESFANIAGATNEYQPRIVENRYAFDSWVFGGMWKDTWRLLGGMNEFEQWGSVDVDFHRRRDILGIRNETLQEFETYCVHQNHDLPDPSNPAYIPTVRDINAALLALPRYEAPSDVNPNYL